MYKTIAVKDLLEKNGVETVEKVLSIFYSRNKEVDDYVKYNAIEFCNRKRTMSYVVFNKVENHTFFVGFFALTLKIAGISKEALETLPKSSSKKIKESAIYSSSKQSYDVPAYLIAHFGKNYNVPKSYQISGNDLMDYVFAKLTEVQERIGGNLVWLECEEGNKKAETFYQKKDIRFKPFGNRTSEKGEDFIQMIRKL